MAAQYETFAQRGRVPVSVRATARARMLGHVVLLKPRVMSLVVFTGAVGFLLAPGAVDWLNLSPRWGHGRGRRRLRRAQHVVGRRHRRANGAHGEASDSARRRRTRVKR